MLRRHAFAVHAPVLTALLCLWLPLGALHRPLASFQEGQPPRVNPDAQALATFQQRVKDYVALHQKLEDTLPKLPTDATPDVVDRHSRALERLIQGARGSAKQGDIFTREARPVFRRLLGAVFTGPNGPKLKATIMEENPGRIVQPRVNQRYPDEFPVSTVPPQVLETLPRLPDDLEYRFIGYHLILLDIHAHLIVDYVSNAIPD
jgi:hypothetical protein